MRVRLGSGIRPLRAVSVRPNLFGVRGLQRLRRVARVFTRSGRASAPRQSVVPWASPTGGTTNF